MLKLYPDERTALFVDGVNSHVTARELGFDVDYKKLYNLFSERCRLVRAFYYTPLYEEENFSPLRPLTDWLDYNGYQMTTRVVRTDTGDDDKPRARQNMDIDVAVDMMKLAPFLQHIVLFSGSGSFLRLVEAVQQRGVRVTVCSTVHTRPPMISDDLRRQADSFLEMDTLRKYIAREGFEKKTYPDQGAEEEEYEDEPDED